MTQVVSKRHILTPTFMNNKLRRSPVSLQKFFLIDIFIWLQWNAHMVLHINAKNSKNCCLLYPPTPFQNKVGWFWTWNPWAKKMVLLQPCIKCKIFKGFSACTSCLKHPYYISMGLKVFKPPFPLSELFFVGFSGMPSIVIQPRSQLEVDVFQSMCLSLVWHGSLIQLVSIQFSCINLVPMQNIMSPMQWGISGL